MPDLTTAAQYGAIDYVFSGSEIVHANTERAFTKAKEVLENYNPTRDYLLVPQGTDPAAEWVCIMSIMGFGIDSIRFLYWDRLKNDDGTRDNRNGVYLPKTLTI